MTYVGSTLARLTLAGLLLTSCTDDDGTKPDADGGNNTGGEDGGSQADTPIEVALPCTDKAADLYAAPAELPTERGAILRCVDDGFISKADVQKRLDELKNGSTTYKGNPASGGVHVYRVLYKTERGNGQPGSSVATVFLPEKPRAEKLPLLLMARGSRGQAAACAPSLLLDPKERDREVDVVVTDNKDGREVNPDFDALLWPVVADGFVLIATDSAGYAAYGSEGNPPSGYAHVADMGKSFLDSGYALRKLVPDATTDDVALVGLSQGGHTVLGSLEVSNTYPAPGPIKGAAVYAPLWFPQRAWGLVMHPSLSSFYKLEAESATGPIAVWYHYTHAEILDGPGEGKKLFKPEFQAQIEDFVNTTCWSADYAKLLETGVTQVAELFDPAFAEAASKGALDRNCDGASDVAVCQKWLDRYTADRPVLSGAAKSVPILVTWGENDTAVSGSFLECAVDALEKSANPLQFCIDPQPEHAGVVLAQSLYVNEWLAEKTLGTPIKASCPKMELPDLGGCQPPQLQE